VPSAKEREAVEQMLAFQSDPSLPALLSGASSVSADPEGEFLGGPGAVVKPSMIDTTESLTPPAIDKSAMPVPGSPLEQQDLVSDGEGAIAVEIDDGGVAEAPISVTPQFSARHMSDNEIEDGDDSDSDEGLTMAKSKKKAIHSRPQLSPRGSPSGSGAERIPVARRRDTDISIASTETAKKLTTAE
jgi:SNF1-activating kinase 1